MSAWVLRLVKILLGAILPCYTVHGYEELAIY